MKRFLSAKRVCAMLILLALVLSIYPAVYASSATIIYNANDWEYFGARTKKQISQKYAAARNSSSNYIDYDESTYYAREPSLTSPYDAGQMRGDVHTLMTEMTNYYRWLVGAAQLDTTSQNNDTLQTAALVRNWQHSHVVDSQNKPADMSEQLWTLGANAEHNIIAWNYTPRDVIAGWIDEGYNLNTGVWDTVGHRASLLFANVSRVDFAFCGNIAMGDQVSFDNEPSLPFYSFPAAGYFPYNDFEATTCAWTIELNIERVFFRKLSDLTVRVTNLNTGESYDCTAANGKLTNRSGSDTFENLLTFVQPACAAGADQYSNGDQFSVEVLGLTDKDTGFMAKLAYTTEFFDVTDFSPATVTDVVAGDFNTLHIYSEYATEENLQMLAGSLPQVVTVDDEYGRTALLPVSGKWTLDVQNQCFVNSCSPDDLPATFRDEDGLLSRITVNYDTSNPKMSNNHIYTPPVTPAGESANIELWRYSLAINATGRNLVYRAVATDDGYNVAKCFDTDAEPYTDGSEPSNLVFTFDALDAVDNGIYFCVYYYTAGSGNSDGFVTDFQKLVVAGGSPMQPTLEKIQLLQRPFKTDYVVSEELDTTGLLLMAYDSDGSSRLVTDYEISGFSSDTAGEKIVTVQYGGKTATFRTEVKEDGAPPQVTPPDADVLAVDIAVYKVTWSVVGQDTTEAYQEGEMPEFKGDTSRADNSLFSYQFTGWSPEVTSVARNVTYTAQYSRTLLNPQFDGSFNDVRSKDWYYDSCCQAAALGLFGGTGNNCFSPNTAMTRAMLVTVLYRMDGEKAVSQSAGFSDVSSDIWYADAVAWAAVNGIVTGVSSDRFAPNNSVTREQVAAILYRYADYMQYDTSPREAISRFTDKTKISAYALDNLRWAIAVGMLQGTVKGSEQYLEPQKSASRAQVATILLRFLEYFE